MINKNKEFRIVKFENVLRENGIIAHRAYKKKLHNICWENTSERNEKNTMRMTIGMAITMARQYTELFEIGCAQLFKIYCRTFGDDIFFFFYVVILLFSVSTLQPRSAKERIKIKQNSKLLKNGKSLKSIGKIGKHNFSSFRKKMEKYNVNAYFATYFRIEIPFWIRNYVLLLIFNT